MVNTNRQPLSARKLDAYRVGVELLSYMRPFLERFAKDDRELASQMKRSLPSIVKNLSEAMRRTGADRAHLLTVALGSADEVRSGIDIALAYGLMQPEQARQAEHLADRFCAMTFRLRQRLA